MDELVAAAKAEGQLTTIALPHDWCGYGAVIDGFKAKYPEITVNELNPDAGSGDEIEAIKANKDNKGPQAPDVIDVGLSFGPSAKADGLIQPYKVSTWDSIPDSAKDAEGYWYGDYYGVLVLRGEQGPRPERAGRLGRPAEAGIRQLGRARRRSARLEPGHPGRLCRRPVDRAPPPAKPPAQPASSSSRSSTPRATSFRSSARPATLAQGQTPILITWDYNALAGRDTLNGNPPVDVVVPKTGVVAGVYVQAISAYAPHPNAAKLWMEYLYSDEGQLGWLKGYCHPIRFNDLAKNGKIPQDLLDKLPPAAAYEAAVFPTLDEQGAAKEAITKNWDAVVGANVQ